MACFAAAPNAPATNPAAAWAALQEAVIAGDEEAAAVNRRCMRAGAM